MDRAVGMVEAKSKLAELVGQVNYAGARFTLERHGRPMAMLISVEEFKRLQTLAGRSEAGTRSPLPLALRRRQELLVAAAQHLEARLGDPVDGLAELFSTLPPAGDDFWVEIQEII